MTKGELVEALKDWPDDAQVEIAIPVDLHSDEPMLEDKIWLEIDMVEKTYPNSECSYDKLCLLFAGKVTME